MSYTDAKYDLSNHVVRVGTDCSGIDTIMIALKMLKVNVIYEWACDTDPQAKSLIMKYHQPNTFFDNIFERNHFELPPIDLYVCGFCCQSFSQIGKKEGMAVDKGKIFYECKEVIIAKSPKWFILENVYGIITHNKVVYNCIKEEMASLSNYDVSFNILNTCDYGIPQSRKRLYIIGTRKDMPSFAMPPPIVCNGLDNYIDTALPADDTKCLIPRRLKVLNHIIQKKNIDMCDNWIITLGASIEYARANLDMCQTITTNCKLLYITSQRRFLSLKELYHLQGFTDEHLYEELSYKQVGNAMSINVLYYVLIGLLG